MATHMHGTSKTRNMGNIMGIGSIEYPHICHYLIFHYQLFHYYFVGGILSKIGSFQIKINWQQQIYLPPIPVVVGSSK